MKQLIITEVAWQKCVFNCHLPFTQELWAILESLTGRQYQLSRNYMLQLHPIRLFGRGGETDWLDGRSNLISIWRKDVWETFLPLIQYYKLCPRRAEGRIKRLCNSTTKWLIDSSRSTSWREQLFKEEDTEDRSTACLIGTHFPLTAKRIFPSTMCHMCPGNREPGWDCKDCRNIPLHQMNCCQPFHTKESSKTPWHSATVFTVNMNFLQIKFQFSIVLKCRNCYFFLQPPNTKFKFNFKLSLKGLMVQNLWICLPISILHLEQKSSQDKYVVHKVFLDSL